VSIFRYYLYINHLFIATQRATCLVFSISLTPMSSILLQYNYSRLPNLSTRSTMSVMAALSTMRSTSSNYMLPFGLPVCSSAGALWPRCRGVRLSSVCCSVPAWPIGVSSPVRSFSSARVRRLYQAGFSSWVLLFVP